MPTTATRITLDEYMNTSYSPDLEFVDGELRERNIGQNEHARMQALLSAWFVQHEEEWHVTGFSGIRTQVFPTAVLLPDLILTRDVPQPRVITAPPVLCVEILSPEDTLAETQRKCQHYFEMGVTACWIIDPERRRGYWSVGAEDENGIWRKSLHLEVPGTGIFADLEPFFEKIARSRA